MRKHVTLTIAVTVALLTGGATHACLWDSDTLATEAKGLPGVVDIIVGRFERNPPLYYEMRLERATKDIDTNPADLNAYDDAATSCDHLNRDDDAIDWMARKKAQLDDLTLPLKPDDRNDHTYRYYANLGTFFAHRWVKGGAHRDNLDDLREAQRLIAAAIEINPDAHFGREKFQLMAIEWLIDPAVGPEEIREDEPALANPPIVQMIPVTSDIDSTEAIKGMTGLIALGAAWQSVDIFESLGSHLRHAGHASLSYVAQLRAEELKAAGRASLHPGRKQYGGVYGAWIIDEYMEQIESYYPLARAAADQWLDRRTAYVLERLKAGRHPDTDPTFWDAWDDEPKLPEMPGLRSKLVASVRHDPTTLTGSLMIAGLVALLGGLYLRRRRRQRSASVAA
ncbi:MAG: hypothetical protein GC159_23035 [Phycisphaera sp.]|nr:hypothetical protein [Phycisphaera sp.]